MHPRSLICVATIVGIITMGAGARGVLPDIVTMPVIVAVFAVIGTAYWRWLRPGG